MERSKELLKHVVENLVDNPSEVSIETKTDEMGILLTLKVAASDMGKIIGKDGSMANALRVVLRAVGAKDRQMIHLRVHDPRRMAHAEAESAQ